MGDMIKVRMDKIDLLDSNIKLNAVEKSRKFKSLRVTMNKLTDRLLQLNKQKRLVEKDIVEATKQLDRVKEELKNIDEDKSPIVTEHAYLRYIERYMGVDLEEVHEKIMALPEEHLKRAGRTVITVFPTPDDHFNLAERESE